MDIVKGNMGWIEVIVGPMFSGKSEELIRRLRRAEIARQRVQIFKPAIDERKSSASTKPNSWATKSSMSALSSPTLVSASLSRAWTPIIAAAHSNLCRASSPSPRRLPSCLPSACGAAILPFTRSASSKAKN